VVRGVSAANEPRVVIKVEQCAIEHNIINRVESGIDGWLSSTELMETVAARRLLPFELRAYRWLLCAELITDRWFSSSEPVEPAAARWLLSTRPRPDRPHFRVELVTVSQLSSKFVEPVATRWLLSTRPRPDRPHFRVELVTVRQPSSSKFVESGTARW
jgi:hypothetical protein